MNKPKLLDQVRTVAALRHLSPRTAEAYAQWIKRFILFHGKKHPLEMGAPEVHAFLSHLAQELNVSASTQNQALNAVAFLYHQVLGQEIGKIDEIPRARKPKRLPVVFAAGEVRNVLSHLSGLEHLMASLLYGSGLRLTECTSLRVKDIDFTNRMIVVRSGKGGRDRTTMLPHSCVPALERQVAEVMGILQMDLTANFAGATMPDSLVRKYPGASRQMAWQYLFPASRRCVDPASGVVLMYKYDICRCHPCT